MKKKDSLTKQEKQEKKRYPKNLKRVEEYFKKLKEDLNKLEKYQYNEDLDHKGIRQIENLFDKSDEEDYYKPIKTFGDFDNEYIEYESKKLSVKDKTLSVKEYLYMIMPYLEKMINDHKASRYWKIQLTLRINFISFLNINDFCTVHTKSDNKKVLKGTETPDIINEHFKPFLRRYQEGLETKMKGSSHIFESVDLSYYHLHKSLNRGGSYINSPYLIISLFDKKSNNKSKK